MGRPGWPKIHRSLFLRENDVLGILQALTKCAEASTGAYWVIDTALGLPIVTQGWFPNPGLEMACIDQNPRIKKADSPRFNIRGLVKIKYENISYSSDLNWPVTRSGRRFHRNEII